MLCLNKRATSPKKIKSKKQKCIRLKHIAIWQNKINDILIQYALPLIIQIGYTCKGQKISVSKDKTKWRYLILSLLSLCFSLRGIKDPDYIGLVESIIGISLLILECVLEHKELAKADKDANNSIPTDYSYVKTPVGTKLVIYFFAAILGLLAYCFSGLNDTWLISLTICSIEIFDTVISVLVIIFDAE